MSEPRILLLIRHGRSKEDSTDLLETPRGLQWDPPLDERGRGQAELLAERLLLQQRPVAVYCSPLRRARETVLPFAERAGFEVRFEDDLMEANIGEWEGKSFEEILGADPELLYLFRNQRAIWHRAPGGEAIGAFRDRVGNAIESILERHPEGDVFVVAHGGVINAYLGPLLGVPDEMFFLPENTSLSSLEVEGSTRRVRFLNDVLHLTDPNLFRPSWGRCTPGRRKAPGYTARDHSSKEDAVPVRFLSEEWATELKERLNASESFKKAAGLTAAKLQQVITGPGGEQRYWIRVGDGAIDMGSGDVDAPDATITEDYETAVALARSELNAVSGFMSGKIRITGNMMLIMQLQAAIAELPRAMQEMDIEY
ncbi:MAG TPA: histidine phosphatase family protein [Actinomycetota bacterium]